MKKFWALICMIACIFGLTACGSQETLTEYEQWKMDYAQQIANSMTINLFAQMMDDNNAAMYADYNAEEIEYMVGNDLGFNVDGNAFAQAIESFHSAKDVIGMVTGTTGTSAVMNGNQIVVEVQVTGEKKNAKAEIIFSNDSFFKLESASLNPIYSMGELMGRAALNTLIGMGTVFIVLILISGIISGFRIIPKLQENAAKKKAGAAGKEGVVGVDNAVARIIEQEVAEETDDRELVAVIAAAIAASEGAASADGFVVRSIIRR